MESTGQEEARTPEADMEEESGQRDAGRQPNLGGCQGSSQGSETVEDDCSGPMLHKVRRGLSQVSQVGLLRPKMAKKILKTPFLQLKVI